METIYIIILFSGVWFYLLGFFFRDHLMMVSGVMSVNLLFTMLSHCGDFSLHVKALSVSSYEKDLLCIGLLQNFGG